MVLARLRGGVFAVEPDGLVWTRVICCVFGSSACGWSGVFCCAKAEPDRHALRADSQSVRPSLLFPRGMARGQSVILYGDNAGMKHVQRITVRHFGHFSGLGFSRGMATGRSLSASYSTQISSRILCIATAKFPERNP